MSPIVANVVGLVFIATAIPATCLVAMTAIVGLLFASEFQIQLERMISRAPHGRR